ncbi:amidase [Variovorax sp. J22G21]|uniref:amidase n=1 Tax=Variovorax fucosicus TaxID=3053517 RepID=UPI0025769C94|nr:MULTISPECIES: amidase [unclassified Variovorax]MDM0042754.1 amidase [Variovorax sp. J22R193]MDM0064851.1 amidase [Variovorax sp. J22G21]
MTVASMAEAVKSGRTSAAERVEATFRCIAALDPSLHAFCTLDEAGARAAAKALDERLGRNQPVGPLAGVPVAIKDLICTKGLRTTFGSRLYAGHVPQEDDVVVERLRAADAIIVGKTNTSEFGYGAFGHNALFPTTRNPWNPDLAPGGSSAGSAAAVAAGMVPLAIGSDGGGSVRVPAALCGIFGLKPSMGRVPAYPGCRDERHPGISSWESLEHIGPMTRTVADAALAMSVLAGPTPKDRFSLPNDILQWAVPPVETLRRVRIAFSPDLGFAAVDPEVRARTEAAVHRLEQVLGCVVQVVQPDVGNYSAVFETLVAMDTDRQGLRRMAAEQRIELQGWLASLLSRDWSADTFTHALMERKRIANTVWRFMEHHDFLITPTTACAAFGLDIPGPDTINGRAVEAGSAWIAFSALANLTGAPAASVPIGLTVDGRPVGLQIMGRHLDDLGVMALSAVVESLFPTSWPPLVISGDAMSR